MVGKCYYYRPFKVLILSIQDNCNCKKCKHVTDICKSKGLNIRYTGFCEWVGCENEQDNEDHTNFWGHYDIAFQKKMAHYMTNNTRTFYIKPDSTVDT